MTAVLLIFAAACCWVGVLGMARMREPLDSLHYLALPATLGVSAVALATWLQTGASQVSMKTTLIAAVLLLFNSVVTHATGRAFRLRQLGHLEVTAPEMFEGGK